MSLCSGNGYVNQCDLPPSATDRIQVHNRSSSSIPCSPLLDVDFTSKPQLRFGNSKDSCAFQRRLHIFSESRRSAFSFSIFIDKRPNIPRCTPQGISVNTLNWILSTQLPTLVFSTHQSSNCSIPTVIKLRSSTPLTSNSFHVFFLFLHLLSNLT